MSTDNDQETPVRKTLVGYLSDTNVGITPLGYITIKGDSMGPSGIVWGKPDTESETKPTERRFAMCGDFRQSDLAYLPTSITQADALPDDWVPNNVL